jgi:hypothetical protein
MDYQYYEIILSPDLALTPADFVATWNETTESRNMAEAQLTTPTGVHYDLPLLATILISVGTGAASNIISDLIMKTLEKRGAHKHTHIEQTKKLDGTESFIVDTDE